MAASGPGMLRPVLRNALEAAEREEHIPRNVAKLVRVPAPRYKINRGLAAQQAKATLKAADGYRLYALYVLALFLGPRRGELLGPRWQDVDLGGAKLGVSKPRERAPARPGRPGKRGPVDRAGRQSAEYRGGPGPGMVWRLAVAAPLPAARCMT